MTTAAANLLHLVVPKCIDHRNLTYRSFSSSYHMAYFSLRVAKRNTGDGVKEIGDLMTEDVDDH